MEKRKADQFVIGKNPLHFCGKQVRKLFKVEGIRRERERDWALFKPVVWVLPKLWGAPQAHRHSIAIHRDSDSDGVV